MPEETLASTVADRPAVSARLLALLGTVLLLALAAGVYVAYRELIHYDRRAIEHVPRGAELGLRIDVEQLVLFEPVRKHLLPLLDRATLAGRGEEASPLAPRLQRLREQAGLNLGLDLREIVFARLPGGAWVLGLGGIFGSQRLLASIEQVLRQEPRAHLRRSGKMLILEPSGRVLAQADDGVLLVGSDAEIIERALRAGRGYEALGLERRGVAAFAARASWFRSLDPEPAKRAPADWLWIGGRLDLGDPLPLTLQIERGAASDPESLRAALETWVVEAPADGQFVPRADWAGERAIVARAEFLRTSDGRTTMSSFWDRSEIDRAARSLAAWLESRATTPPGPRGPIPGEIAR